MKTLKKRGRICVLLMAAVLLLSLLTGCSAMWQSGEYLACERVAERFADGEDYTKEDIIASLGRPSGFENKSNGVDYMDPKMTWWSYEVYEFSGYPWRLSLQFDSNGNVISAEFFAAPGG